MIAIIGILSAIITSSLGKSRNKAADTKVVQTFRNIKIQAEVYVEDQTNFCQKVANLSASVDGQCHLSGTQWAVYAPLKEPEPGKAGLCIDSAGRQQQVNEFWVACNPTTCLTGGPCMP